MAEPVVSFLLENISKLLIDEGKFLAGVSEQAEQLQSKLRLMLSLLKDADARQDEDAVIREWSSQSKDVAYEAENAFETFAFEVEPTKRKGIVNVLKRYGIRSIMERAGPSSRQQQLMTRTYSHVEEEDFVGLESDVKTLVEQLVNEDVVRVISICGMGGLGKTTIARNVYNHPNVRRYFDGIAWVCISQQWKAKDILQGILVKIIPEKIKEILKFWTNDMLVRQLYSFQLSKSKRCLIVLDDIWSIDAWDGIKDAFPNGGRGSKILLTTRNKNVSIQIEPNGFHHEPRLLSQNESWELLQKEALRQRYALSHGDLIHLRYLCLRDYDFLMFPSSSGNLEHLETLDLRGYNRNSMWIRDVLRKLKGLKQLYLPVDYTFPSRERLFGLTKLEILENFKPQYFEINDLWSQRRYQVFWRNCIAAIFIIYILIVNIGMLPKYKTDFFRNLIELVLTRSLIERDPMETLEKLPSLQRLWLKDGAFVGEEMICHRMGFPQLTFLSLRGLPWLRCWRVEDGAMANLCRLKILSCFRLEMIPDGFRYITTLSIA
ncbi:hypothetical protein ACH5RR_031710 [Cinchona calisaya]|uniref:Disease resistance protein n=1 Tax=Cinchona calisaya TaxID=153742 RepID=A0ABD2YL99_9GENT